MYTSIYGKTFSSIDNLYRLLFPDFLEYNTAQSIEVSLPSVGTHRLHLHAPRVSQVRKHHGLLFGYYSTPKLEALCSSETSLAFTGLLGIVSY
jgi:hypothetical protein